jgi:hypothetical protein
MTLQQRCGVIFYKLDLSKQGPRLPCVEKYFRIYGSIPSSLITYAEITNRAEGIHFAFT